MSYRKFTLTSVKKQFSLVDKTVDLFANLEPIDPSNWLLETLEYTKGVAYFSEKSRSEAIVMPILIEKRKKHNNSFSIYSGAILDIDKKQGLSGEVDFILGYSTQNYEVEAPLFCMVEAKDNDIEVGLGQCVAQLIGARTLNQREEYDLKNVYGCVTTGEAWQFLKLEDNIIFLDSKRYYLRNLEEILGIFERIIVK